MSLPHPEGSKIIVFDGVCKLCSGWASFIIRFDTQRHFTLATVQSNEGQALLAHFDYPTNHYNTMLYIEGNNAYAQSTAFLKIIWQLPFPWPLLTIGWLIPRPIRNWLYDRIALNRYRIFGRYDHCLMPSADHDERFLNNAHKGKSPR